MNKVVIVLCGLLAILIVDYLDYVDDVNNYKKGIVDNTSDYFSINFNDNKIPNNNTKLSIDFLAVNKSKKSKFWPCLVKDQDLCSEIPKKSKPDLDKKNHENTKNIAIHFALQKAGYTEKININHEYNYYTGQQIDNTYQPYKYKDKNNKEIINQTIKCSETINKNCVYVGENITTNEDIKKKIDITYKSEQNLKGNSSGLMWALYLYSQISNEKLGEKYSHIAGTGSLHSSGDIGGVGGVTAKVEAAYAQNVDVVFVPKLPALDKSKKSNCEEAHSVPKDENVKTQIVCVNHFDEVLDYLKK